MAMHSFGGIDVSKDRLDVMALPEEQCSSVPNDAAGWAKLVEQLRGFSISAVGIEASGGYERGAVRALLAAGMSVRQVNPFKLRQFARASGVLAKNDPLDARMIASFIAIMPTRPAQPHAPAVERLAEILTMRRQLSDAKVAAENASRLLEDAMLQRLSRRRMMQRARNCGAAAPTVGAWIVDFELPLATESTDHVDFSAQLCHCHLRTGGGHRGPHGPTTGALGEGRGREQGAAGQ